MLSKYSKMDPANMQSPGDHVALKLDSRNFVSDVKTIAPKNNPPAPAASPPASDHSDQEQRQRTRQTTRQRPADYPSERIEPRDGPSHRHQWRILYTREREANRRRTRNMGIEARRMTDTITTRHETFNAFQLTRRRQDLAKARAKRLKATAALEDVREEAKIP